MLRIKMYPAKNGDAFLLSSEKTHILIDGGYPSTFNHAISDDLHVLASQGKSLDLIIVTHIDADHIGGILRLLSVNGSATEPAIIPIEQIWHNSLRSLTSPCEHKIPPEQHTLLQAINQRGHPFSLRDTASGNVPNEISAKQGCSLARLIFAGGYSWNGGDGTMPVSAGTVYTLPHNEDIVAVLTPSNARLQDLLALWKKYLQRIGYRMPAGSGEIIDDAFEFTLEHLPEGKEGSSRLISASGKKTLEDTYTADLSVTNGSSISAIFDIGGVRLLMLADAWAEDVVTSLKALAGQGVSMMFDAIKIAHHGSFHNTSPELLNLVDAPVYFISTDGSKHDHPDSEVLAAIVDRPADFPRTLYFNYATPSSGEIRHHISAANTDFTVIENAADWIEIGNDQ